MPSVKVAPTRGHERGRRSPTSSTARAGRARDRCEYCGISQLKDQDFLAPLNSLSHEEQVRLARLALSVAASTGSLDFNAYRKWPEGQREFSSMAHNLAWDAEGWRSFGGAG